MTGLENGLRGRCARLSRVSGFYDPASVLICVAVRLCRLPDCRDGPPLSPTLYLTLASGMLRTCGCDVSLHFEPQAVTAEDTVNMIQTLRDQTPSEFLGTVNREIKGRGLHRVALNTPCKLAGS